MLKKSFFVKSALFLTVGLLIVSCGNEKPKEETTTLPAQDTTAAVETPTVSYTLPSPLQIASIFKKSGLKYKDGVTSPEKDPGKFTTKLNKALNLGVYSADLSYAVLNKQNQESMNFMKLSRQLADKLGIGTIFDQGDLSKRFEKNLGNEDSLAYIIAELQMQTDMYLDENDQQELTSIVFAGAWVESLHIGANVYEKKDKSLNNKLAEQMTILSSIIKALGVVEKKDTDIPGLIADLSAIKDIYDKLPTIVKSNAAADDTTQELTLTDDEVNQLTVKIEALRAKFIKA